MSVGRDYVVYIRPLTTANRVRCKFSPCGIYGEQGGSGTGFPRIVGFYPAINIPPMLNSLSLTLNNLSI